MRTELLSGGSGIGGGGGTGGGGGCSGGGKKRATLPALGATGCCPLTGLGMPVPIMPAAPWSTTPFDAICGSISGRAGRRGEGRVKGYSLRTPPMNGNRDEEGMG